jgi:hypothetical protein
MDMCRVSKSTGINDPNLSRSDPPSGRRVAAVQDVLATIQEQSYLPAMFNSVIERKVQRHRKEQQEFGGERSDLLPNVLTEIVRTDFDSNDGFSTCQFGADGISTSLTIIMGPRQSQPGHICRPVSPSKLLATTLRIEAECPGSSSKQIDRTIEL